jgi:4-hydroxy-3-polyprenylbenzoate decarboxylase
LHLTSAVELKKTLERRAIPVTDVYLPPEMGGLLIIIGVKKTRSDIISQIADVAFMDHTHCKIIVVDEDVDVFNLHEVLHTFFARCHPGQGIIIKQLEYVASLTPYLSDEERGTGKAPGVLFDSTWPLDWSKETSAPPKMSFLEAYPESIKKKVVQGWSNYGFGS